MKNNTPNSSLNKISNLLVLSVVALLPILVIPLTNNFVSQTKSFYFTLVAIILMFVFVIRSFKKQSWEMVASPVIGPLFLFGLSTLATVFFSNSYPVKSLIGMGGIYLAVVLIATLGASLIKTKKNYFIEALSIAGAILAVSSLLQLVGFGPSKLINSLTDFNLPDDLLFNLAGSSFVAAQIMILALVGNFAQITKKKFISTINLISVPILLFGLCLYIWSMLPGKIADITLPPLAASWSVALDSIREPRAALIGQGTESYSNMYSKFRPLWTNGQEYWQFNFSSGTNLPLTLLVTSGFMGLATWFLLAYQFTKKAIFSKSATKSPVAWVIFAAFLLQLLLPTNVLVLGIQAAALAFWAASLRNKMPVIKFGQITTSIMIGTTETGQQVTKTSNWLLNIINSALLVGLLILTFFTAKAYLSFHQLYLAAKAFVANDVVTAYNHQMQAVSLNPYLDSTRREYALTNLDIAIALSNKSDITEEEQKQVSQLVSQAIRDAQDAIALDQNNSQNWLVLAQIYQNLINSDETATQYTIDAYVSAIQNDPANPLLRVELGSLFFNAKQYGQAANFYNQAVELKPDLPIAYYQLGRALYANNQIEQAQKAWQAAQSLLPPESENYTVVTENLEEVTEKIKEASESGKLKTGMGEIQEETSPLGSQLQSITEQNVERAGEADVVEAPMVDESLEDIDLEPAIEAVGEEEMVDEDEQPVE